MGLNTPPGAADTENERLIPLGNTEMTRPNWWTRSIVLTDTQLVRLEWSGLAIACVAVLALAAYLAGAVAPWLGSCALGLSLLGLGAMAGAFVLRNRRRPAPASTEEKPAGRLTMKSLDYLVSLLNVSRAVSSGTTPQELGQVIVDSCLDCFDCQEASVMMLDRATDELAVTAFAGHRDTAVVRKARVKIGEGVAGTVAQNRTPLILGPRIEPRKFPGFKEKARHIQYSMIAPIVVRDRLEGVLNVSTGDETAVYTEDDLRVLCILAEHAGIVVAKSRDHARVTRLIRRIRRRGLRPPRRSQESASPGEARRAA